jgi:hypothetical protein
MQRGGTGKGEQGGEVVSDSSWNVYSIKLQE